MNLSVVIDPTMADQLTKLVAVILFNKYAHDQLPATGDQEALS